ncbi:polyphenol oxidase, chloroplastic-like [Dorcoceras hygrometricum]|uniref:Polyphenol oxidase, chloroplastic-like n=1 Tax=Dorcoceras hygrometricum TaxID=472368 RepID=A0A2Z7B6W4_9LAMI|nr:polyphenol oxidase, chloroplastic-like [Dorcoceras hygrometricum]
MATVPVSWSTHLPQHRRGSAAKPPHYSGHTSKIHRLAVSCNQTKDGGNQEDDVENSPGKFDRRNVLLGMGGLYGATNLVSSNTPAVASPISSPDLTKCTKGTNLNTNKPLDVNCCPPLSTQIIDYKLPPVEKFRVRPAAQTAGEEYYAKFEKAIELMKALPADDPRSFMQQANVHCAYCNLTYEQAGDNSKKLQIHNCWLFFPWHRWYLYFYERILGKLIDDPTFGLPFWNWDHPDGMPMPERFARSESPLYDARRNLDHLPPALLDLNYSPNAPTKPKKIVSNNLTVMYTEMIRNVKKLDDFYGAKYVTGSDPNPGPGTVERGSHTAAHVWTGEATATGEDMGNFYSTGREPLFFAHHANVDRLWTLWRGLRGSKPKEYTEAEWLNTDFLFYDENAQLVRVTVKDTLENEKMGYVYEEKDLPWLKRRPTARVRKSKVAKVSKAPKSEENIFPVKLDKVVKVLVPRPKRSRSKKDKEKEEELLVIKGIEVNTSKFVKFDVFINDEDDKPDELDKAEFAGSYSQVPHKNSVNVKTKIRLGLTELLEDLDVEDDDKVLVSLVPKAGGESISIGGIKIIYT